MEVFYSRFRHVKPFYRKVPPTDRPRKSPWPLIIFVVIVLLGVIYGSRLDFDSDSFLFKLKERLPFIDVNKIADEDGNSAGNINNSGLAAYRDGWIYYVNNLYKADNPGIYKIRGDLTGQAELIPGDFYYLNVVGEWIYYANPQDDGTIYKARLDGSEVTRVNDDFSVGFIVVGQWIYYLNIIVEEDFTRKIYRIKTDGTERSKLNDHYSLFINVVDDWIYYGHVVEESENDLKIQPYRMRTDGSEQVKISDRNVLDLNVVDGWLYYYTFSDGGGEGRGIYRMRTDGSEVTLIKPGSVWSINVVGDYIYYSAAEDEYGIFRMNTSGDEITLLSSDAATHLNVAGGWIYYCNLDDDYSLYRMRTDGSDRQKLNDQANDGG